MEEVQEEVYGEEPEEEAAEEPQEEEQPQEEEAAEEAPEDEAEASLEKKSGPELFREVLRLLDTAGFEDYFKNGRWDDALMRMDVVLLDAHRKEAGASEPPDLKDVELPANIPKATGAFGPGTMFGAKPAGAVTAVSAAGGQVAELRLISLFVAKWQLDPTPTKTILAKLTPPRRRYVIQSFKATEKGPGAGDELKEYIAKCEKTNAWAAAEKAAAMAAARPAAIAQRSACAPPAWAGATQAWNGASFKTAAGSTQRPAVLGARPMGAAAVRPMIRPMGPAGFARPGVASPGTFARPGAFARPASIVGPSTGLKRPISSVSGPISTGAAALRQRIAAQSPGANRVGPASFTRPVTPRPVTPTGARAGYGTGAGGASAYGASGPGARFAGTGAGYAAQVGRVRVAQPATIRPVTPGAYKPAVIGYSAPRAGAFTPRPGGTVTKPGSFGSAAVRASSAPVRPTAPKPAGEKPGGLIRDLLQRL